MALIQISNARLVDASTVPGLAGDRPADFGEWSQTSSGALDPFFDVKAAAPTRVDGSTITEPYAPISRQGTRTR